MIMVLNKMFFTEKSNKLFKSINYLSNETNETLKKI